MHCFLRIIAQHVIGKVGVIKTAIAAGATLLYALPYFAFLRRVEEPQTDKPSTTAGITFTALGRSRTFMLLCLVFPVFVFGIWLLYGWLPAFLHDKFSLNQADAAFNATAFLQTATFIGVIGGGMIADALFHRTKAARFWLMVAGLALSAPCIHLLGNSDTLLVTRIAATGFGLFSGLFIANIFPAAFDVVSGDARATAVGGLGLGETWYCKEVDADTAGPDVEYTRRARQRPPARPSDERAARHE